MSRSRRPASSVAIACLLVVAWLATGSAGVAAAAVDPWVTDGQVAAIVRSGDTVYLGGDFSRVGPRTGPGMALDGASGAMNPAFAKVAGAYVVATAPDGSGGWYIGGNFTAVGGVPRANLAHILPSGAVDPNWNPGAVGEVSVLKVSGSTVYAGGGFFSVGGQSRERLAALDATSGAVLPWNPRANDHVSALAVAGSTVYAGG